VGSSSRRAKAAVGAAIGRPRITPGNAVYTLVAPRYLIGIEQEDKDMQNLPYSKRTVFILLSLHTAIFIALTCIAAAIFSSLKIYERIDLILVYTAIAVLFTYYTGKRIIASVNELLRANIKKINQMNEKLRDLSVNLDVYNRELERRSKLIDEKQALFEEHVGVITQYGDRMAKLVAEIDASQEVPSLVGDVARASPTGNESKD
jgi:hypothetical protein